TPCGNNYILFSINFINCRYSITSGRQFVLPKLLPCCCIKSPEQLICSTSDKNQSPGSSHTASISHGTCIFQVSGFQFWVVSQRHLPLNREIIHIHSSQGTPWGLVGWKSFLIGKNPESL